MTDHSEFDPERPAIWGRLGSHPIVDIDGVPEEYWVEVLSRLHPSTHGPALEAMLNDGRDEPRVPGVDQILREAKPRG